MWEGIWEGLWKTVFENLGAFIAGVAAVVSAIVAYLAYHHSVKKNDGKSATKQSVNFHVHGDVDTATQTNLKAGDQTKIHVGDVHHHHAPAQPTTTEPAAKSPAFRAAMNNMPLGAGDNFVAREAELAQIDRAWESEKTNVLSLVAGGGVGKTSVVRHWLAEMAADNWRGAESVFCWSFYSQGTRDLTEASGDAFLDKALEFFGPDPKPEENAPMSKGQRLAGMVAAGRHVLVLDGMEPLQYPRGHMEGRLKDPGVEGLALGNHGLCLVTTRETPTDLGDYVGGTADGIDLTNFQPAEGAALLRMLEVDGEDDELEQASRDVDGHGLALTLMGSYLRDACGGDVRKRGEINLMGAAAGEHAEHVMQAYVNWFGPDSPEVSILRLLGLFDRPAEAAAVRALREAAPIDGLTAPVKDLMDTEWNMALSHLRRAGLVAGTSDDEGALDAHPLLREYFADRLQENAPAAWKAGNGVLFDHYKDATEKFPDTADSMAPLFAAVAHGCRAGWYLNAYWDVLRERIDRHSEHFSVKKLGLFGPRLSALAGFFEPEPPWTRLVADVDDANRRSFLLHEAGFGLRAQGRLKEAIAPLTAALEIAEAPTNWLEFLGNAAISAGNLSQTRLAIGDIAGAVAAAETAVRHADNFGQLDLSVVRRGDLANARAEAGETEAALVIFRSAEDMLANREQGDAVLSSVSGYQYCNLLLDDRSNAGEVREQAAERFEALAKQGFLLDNALHNLILGRAGALLGLTDAGGSLNAAVDGLRRFGHLEFIPKGLLVRAEVRREN